MGALGGLARLACAGGHRIVTVALMLMLLATQGARTVDITDSGQLEVPAAAISAVMAAIAVAASVACVRLAPAAIKATGREDPGEVVADEVAGQAVTFVAVPLLFAAPPGIRAVWSAAGAGFVAFRLFDIIKPWPVKNLEKLPKGWGILADDLMAGVFAAILTAIFTKFWIVGRAVPAFISTG